MAVLESTKLGGGVLETLPSSNHETSHMGYRDPVDQVVPAFHSTRVRGTSKQSFKMLIANYGELYRCLSKPNFYLTQLISYHMFFPYALSEVLAFAITSGARQLP